MKRTNSDNIEELILNGVDRVLAKEGYEQVNLERVAREIGLKKETVSILFPSNEDLLLTHIDRIVREVIAQLRLVAQKGDHPAEKIREMLRLRVMLRFDAVQHYAESLGNIVRDLRLVLLERREFYFDEEAKVFADVLAQGRKAGVLRVSDCAETAAALIDATNSVLPFNLSEQELNSRSKIEKRTARIADLILQGLLASNGSSHPNSRSPR